MQKGRRFLYNAVLLAVVNIALRLIGVSFNTFVTAKVGAEGMGLLTLVMSVYGLSVTVAASGVNLAAVQEGVILYPDLVKVQVSMRDGAVIGLDHFGASAPYKLLFKEYGFTAENVAATAKSVIK